MRILIALLLITAPAYGERFASSWTQWRGPNRDGVIKDGSAWPTALPQNAVLRKGLGPSYSGPIVVGSTMFVTETKDRKYEAAAAIDLETGQQIWRTQWEGAMKVPFFAKANGDWIRSTPAFDGDKLYVAGMRDVLVCLDAKTGKIVWKKDFVKEMKTPLPSFGFVSSPLIDKEAVYVQAGGGLLKLNKQTGELIWRALADGGGMYGSAFSSPVIAKINGVEQLVVQTRTRLCGVRMADGKELWTKDIPAFRGMNILTPTVVNNSIFTSSYGGKTMALSVDSDGVNQKWTNKTQGYMSSPIVLDGHMYMHLRNQRVVCVELETGKICWTTRPYGKYWSMVANGDKIMALDERGDLFLIKANPEKFELLDKKKVTDESAWAHLAIAGDRVFVRDLKGISVLKW